MRPLLKSMRYLQSLNPGIYIPGFTSDELIIEVGDPWLIGRLTITCPKNSNEVRADVWLKSIFSFDDDSYLSRNTVLTVEVEMPLASRDYLAIAESVDSRIMTLVGKWPTTQTLCSEFHHDLTAYYHSLCRFIVDASVERVVQCFNNYVERMTLLTRRSNAIPGTAESQFAMVYTMYQLYLSDASVATKVINEIVNFNRGLLYSRDAKL